MTSHKVANLAAWDAAVLDARRMVTRAQKCRAYQFCDGFDNYSTLSNLWETVSGSATIGTSYRRFAPPSGCPGQGLYLTSGSYARRNLQSNQAALIGKAGYKQLGAPTSVTQIFGFYDAGTNQVAICCTISGAIAAYGGWNHVSGDILLGQSGPGLIFPGDYYGIEAEITFNPSSGAITVWLDGDEVLNISTVNTAFSGDAYANQLQINDSGSGNPGAYFDDVRVWDSTGSTQNAPIGAGLLDSRLITKLPSGAGALAQFTPNGASANWQCVDENPPDGDTTYVSGATAGLEDAYDMPSAGFTAAPVMTVARAYARKDDSNTRQLAVGVSSGGHSAVGATATLSSSYAFVDGSIADDPNTGSPPTAVAADAFQFFREEIA